MGTSRASKDLLHKKKLSRKIGKLRKEGFPQKVAVGRAFGILKAKHK